MFDFLFRRLRPAAGTSPEPVTVASPKVVVPAAPSVRETACDRANLLGNDEAGAVTFILGCSIAEARLLAAQQIHSRAALETVRKAMRETDRRVARLMQQRLDALQLQETSMQRAQVLIAQATSLCAEPALRPNQVVSLEQAWQAIDASPASAREAFDELRHRLEQRLSAQSGLQRRVLDAIASIRQLLTDAAAAGNAIGAIKPINSTDAISSDSTVDIGEAVDQAVCRAAASVDELLAQTHGDPELASLPRHLLPELLRLREQLRCVHDGAIARQAAFAVREQALSDWETRVATGPTDDAKTPGSAAAMREAWQAMPGVDDAVRMARLSQRFEQLVATLVPAPASSLPAGLHDVADVAVPLATASPDTPNTQATPVAVDMKQWRLQFSTALQNLQSALEEGALQRAVEQDRLLRTLEADAAAPAAGQRSALSSARAELARLQGWARWGGTISREELLTAVELLPGQGLAIGELAKKVGTMRERWRSLDTSAGAAPRALWLRFDAACTLAYAPVAAHLAALAAERALNAEKAQMLLNEIAVFKENAAMAGCGGAATSGETDWRALTAFCQRMRQAWQRIGPIERKQQKRLELAFAAALEPLQTMLAAQQSHELMQREQLIAEVTRLAPQSREAPERVQATQARWQQLAKSFPLARQQEQLLWQRFRAACDAVYTQRKNAGAAADAQRSASFVAKQELCVALETLAADINASDAQRGTTLRDIRTAWDAAGPVPRALQTDLQSRYDTAVKAIGARRIATRKTAARLECDAIQARLQLCMECEGAVVSRNGTLTPAAARVRWTALPSLSAAFADVSRVLEQRLGAAIVALDADDAGYGKKLLANQAARDAQLLAFEVACGIDTPSEYRRDRLALQVAGLQSTFRRGASDSSEESRMFRLARLCEMAAIADDLARRRIDRLVERLASSEQGQTCGPEVLRY